jgi:hypothetical protein
MLTSGLRATMKGIFIAGTSEINKLSSGEICVINFITLANVKSLGSYFSF